MDFDLRADLEKSAIAAKARTLRKLWLLVRLLSSR